MVVAKIGWVFVDDDTNEQVGYAPAGEFETAGDAVHSFGNEYGDGDFGVYFRNAAGQLCVCDEESCTEDFLEGDE